MFACQILRRNNVYRPLDFRRIQAHTYSVLRKPNNRFSRIERPPQNATGHPKNSRLAELNQPSAQTPTLELIGQLGQTKEGLKRLLSNDTLVVSRQIEMLNIMIGFEQANRYAITNEHGTHLGYIAEEERSFLWSMSRQLLRTHRPFRALIMDPEGIPLLWVRRPFAFINSRMFVQWRHESSDPQSELETFGEVQQVWHPWRRKYDLFLRKAGMAQSSSEKGKNLSQDHSFAQFARVDSGFWAWDFPLYDAQGDEIASVSRGFGGWGRELFTDTGTYTVRFIPRPPDPESLEVSRVAPTRNLTLDERALVLALSVDVDYDYFSRHSEGRAMTPWLFFGGSDE